MAGYVEKKFQEKVHQSIWLWFNRDVKSLVWLSMYVFVIESPRNHKAKNNVTCQMEVVTHQKFCWSIKLTLLINLLSIWSHLCWWINTKEDSHRSNTWIIIHRYFTCNYWQHNWWSTINNHNIKKVVNCKDFSIIQSKNSIFNINK